MMYFTLKSTTLKRMQIVVSVQDHLLQGDFISRLLLSSLLSIPLLSILDIPLET